MSGVSEIAKGDFALRPARAQLSPNHTRNVNWLLYLSILFRVGFLVYYFTLVPSWWSQGDDGFISVSTQDTTILWAVHVDMIAMSVILWFFARWEDQGHLVTLWQALYTLEVLAGRQVFYNNVAMLSIAFIGLYVTYLVGIFTEFRKAEPARLPPFPPKKNDVQKPRYGWLGKTISHTVTGKWSRCLVTAFLYSASMIFSIFMLYAFLVSEVDDFRNLPAYQNANKTAHQNGKKTDFHVLTPLLIVAIVASLTSMLPPLLVEFGVVPGLVKDVCQVKTASRSYNTGVWDVCELNEDKDGPGPALKDAMTACGKLLDLTIVLPCYLPNEEDILPLVWGYYIDQFQKLREYESEVLPYAKPCRKEILVVYNSPDSHPNFQPMVDEWQTKFEKTGFVLRVKENSRSTSKCDNLNMACDKDSLLIETEMCCLNDADTMLDWSCMVRGSIHIHNGYDLAQAMNTHCKYDCRGTPGDDVERQCHPYGILIAIGDATKPQNMSTQTPFKHSPFNGRGGFWKTESVCKVGFDHRTVGEDHDAGYRGFAYFGMTGLLDMNMLCQEQEPPNCGSLTSQRIRWETAALEMRRTFSWILRSPHYTNWETFILLWGQLQQNCNLPLQSSPFQVATALPLVIMKGWMSIYGFGQVGDHWCAKSGCAWSFEVTSPVTGHLLVIALPLPLVIFCLCGLFFMAVNAFDYLARVATTRYRSRLLFMTYYAMLKGMFVLPYFIYVQYWALHDYCWGDAKFIATARSPLSPKKEDGGSLQKPLLP